MRIVWKAFGTLYFAALLMLVGSSLLNTYLGLRLAEGGAADFWVGALMAANYFGLVIGGRIGHRLIARVGHIRAYVTCAGIMTAAVLGHGLIDELYLWLAFRVLIGVGLMCQYMVIESWLNEQAAANERGLVFSGYMLATFSGQVLGQLALRLQPNLGVELLMLVALCFALCLVPVALTGRLHPKPLHPVPFDVRFFFQRVPQSLTTMLIAGLITGSFYGLAPLYALRQGLDTGQISLFMGVCVLAGLLAQAPLGWLSDRYDRAALIFGCALLLAFAALPLAVLPLVGLAKIPLPLIFACGFVACLLQFCLYPLAVAFSNDHMESERRVELSAMLLVTYGVGACIGPLACGFLMRAFGSNMLYLFASLFALLLALRVRPASVTHKHRAADAPMRHVAVPGDLTHSPLSAALDPRVDDKLVEEQMQEDEHSKVKKTAMEP